MFGYIEGSFLVSRTGDAREHYMLLIYIGAYAHKYIGHEIANWWGWGGRRSEHCREVWVGGRRDSDCDSG